MRQVRVQKTKRPDPRPEPDLRTPSGRSLPY
jgi:hypothetical protein